MFYISNLYEVFFLFVKCSSKVCYFFGPESIFSFLCTWFSFFKHNFVYFTLYCANQVVFIIHGLWSVYWGPVPLCKLFLKSLEVLKRCGPESFVYCRCSVLVLFKCAAHTVVVGDMVLMYFYVQCGSFQICVAAVNACRCCRSDSCGWNIQDFILFFAIVWSLT